MRPEAKLSTGRKVSLAKATDHRPNPAQEAASLPMDEGLGLIMARNGFYRQNQAHVLYVLLFQIATIIALSLVLMRVFVFTAPRDYYFPVREDNVLITEFPLGMPVYSDTDLERWAERAVTETLTFGFHDYQMRLQSSRSFFTMMGWNSFLQAMEDSGVMRQIGATTLERPPGAEQQVIRATLRQPAKITAKGQMENLTYIWRVSLDIDITYYSLKKQYRMPWLVEIRIERVPAMEGRYGLGIAQLIAKDAKR